MDSPQAAGQHGLDLDPLLQRAPQQLRYARDQPVGLQHARRQCLRAREGEQLRGERDGALGAFLRMVDGLDDAGLVITRQAPPGEIEAADDDGQHIVEIMRDAAVSWPTASIFWSWRTCPLAWACAAISSLSRRWRSLSSAM